MFDIIIEILRAIVVGWLIYSLRRSRYIKDISGINGWQYMSAGITLIFFGTLIDITDNFSELNQFVVIGHTQTEVILEKLVGYLAGFVLIAIGIWRWLPKVIEHRELIQTKLDVQEERLRVLRATMLSVDDIVLNLLNTLQLFRIEAVKSNALEPDSIKLFDSVIYDAEIKLKKISSLESTPEKVVGTRTAIDYD